MTVPRGRRWVANSIRPVEADRAPGPRVLVVLTGVPATDADLLAEAERLGGAVFGLRLTAPRETGEPTGPWDAVKRTITEGGGAFHEVVSEDWAPAIVRFATLERCSDIVVGLPRPDTAESSRVRLRRLLELQRGHEARLHIVPIRSENAIPAASRHGGSLLGLTRRRRLWALALAATLLPAATIGLRPDARIVSLQSVLLVYLLVAVVVAVVGGTGPGIGAALVGFFLANWFFTEPRGTWTVEDPENLFALMVFLVVASSVGALVGRATRQADEAKRAQAHAEALVASTTTEPTLRGLDTLVARVRVAFGADAVSMLQHGAGGWRIQAASGPQPPDDPAHAAETIPIGADRVLALNGVRLAPEDHRVLAAFATYVADALERDRLRHEVARVEAMAEADRLRTALLGAVSHDLRTPIASIKASVTSLLETDIAWSPEQTDGFLHTIRAESERLNRLVGQLLDASRIQVGAVEVRSRPTAPDEVVSAALASLSVPTGRIEVKVDESLPLVDTDPILLERVVANLIDNALTHAPGPVTVRALEESGRLMLEIVDHGPGIPPELREHVFQPFQRLDDGQAGGVGLGLAVSRGFLESLHTELTVATTPGGGTTMRIPLKVAGATT